MTEVWRADVIVAGGGPAGSACATLLARRGCKVLLIDHRSARKWRPAEILSPHTLRLLRQHDLFSPSPSADTAACMGVEGRWNGEVEFFDYALLGCESAVTISRPLFDSALVHGARTAGVEYWDAWLEHAAFEAGMWTVQVLAGEQLLASAPLLIEAMGRNGGSLVGQTARVYFDRLIALAWRARRPPRPQTTMTLEATPNGWWYASCDASGDAAAVFMTDADLLRHSGHARDEAFRSELAATQLIRRRVAELPAHLELVGIDARTSRREHFHGAASIAVGDAAYSVDPLSGAGIQRCVETAVQAAAASVEFLAHDRSALQRYATWARGDFERWLANKDDVYAEVDPDLPKGMFWNRRLSSYQGSSGSSESRSASLAPGELA
jgi:2-polyprenyl-6-methoxyphenol hydroxylase-like FAD-dependent oxidoreductase